MKIRKRGMTAAGKTPDLKKVALKYKDISAFSKAARLTFSKGRMTLKTKKDFNEGERIVISVSIPQLNNPVEIISEIIQKKPAAEPETPNIYGVRWLNFTEKKLKKLEELADSQTSPPEEKTPKPADKEHKAKKPDSQAKAPEQKPKAKPKPAESAVGAAAASPPPKDLPPPPPVSAKTIEFKKNLEADEEYTISQSAEGAYPSFEERAEVIVPPPPEESPASPETGEERQPASEEASRDNQPTQEQPEPESAKALEPEADTSLEVQPVQSEPEAPEPAAPQPADENPQPEALEPAAPQPADERPQPEPPETGEASPAPEPRPGESELKESIAPEAPEESPQEKETEEISPAGQEGAPEEEPVPLTEAEPDQAAPSLEEEQEPPEPGPREDTEPEPEPVPVPSEKEETGEPSGQAEPSAREEPSPAPIVAAAPEPTPVPGKPLSPEELKALSGFLQRLLALLTRPDQAYGEDSERKLKSLYEEWKKVMGRRDEIVLFLRTVGAAKEYMFAGEGVAPANLKNVLDPEEFAALAKKLVDFFEAKKLAGIQFRRYLTEDGFRQFVVRMGRYDPENQSPEELASGLVQDGVFHITPVHEEDRVSGASSLDFRVDLTLSRLRGDLKRIRLLTEAMMEEDPRAVWTLRVEDALKPLSSGRLRAEALLNAHLVTQGQEEFSATELIQEMIFATPVDMLEEAGEFIADFYEQLAENKDQLEPEERKRLEVTTEVLRHLTARLIVEKPETGTRIMYGLYKKGVFELGELPRELRERVMIEQFLETFLQDPDTRLQDFQRIANLKDYKVAANRYARMVVELLRKREIQTALKVFQVLASHARADKEPFPGRTAAAREAFRVFAEPESIRVALEALKDADKKDREKIAALVYVCGPLAAEPVIKTLAVEEDRALRSLLCKILLKLGPKAAETMARKALDRGSPWFLVRNLVMVMGEMKSPALKDNLEELVKHEHPRVREEALIYAAKVFGKEGEAWLKAALSDQEPAVKRRALKILSRFPEFPEDALPALVKIIEEKPSGKEAPPELESLVEEAAETLAKLGGRELPGGETVSRKLMDALEAEAGKGLLARIAGGKSARTPRMKAALIKALGETGERSAEKLLKSFVKDKEAQVREAAQAALEKLKKKEG